MYGMWKEVPNHLLSPPELSPTIVSYPSIAGWTSRVFPSLEGCNLPHPSRKHLRTKVTPDFQLRYNKNGAWKSGVWIKIIKMDKNQYFSKIICCGCVLESPHRGDSNTHPQHMILWRTHDNLGKNTGLLWKLYEYGDVHVKCRSQVL